MGTDLVLGTAGHIDHGKTALVRALTGVDTDRLPEEKRRGITIDLGFAELDLGEYRLGIVDVPGHERFVRNMLAGASGVDLAMLVVAADDSVKPQTREHLEILRLLDLQTGVLVLTKCDLAEPAWIDLVEAEVRELVAGSFLAAAPLVRTSAVTGQGLDRLREALAAAAAAAAASARRHRLLSPFRMAIDRVFTLAGHGTVVTGSVSTGTLRLGDEVAVEPGGLRGKVRGLENHGRGAEAIHRGQRAAVNLSGIHHEQLQRGQELAAPGHLVPGRLLSVGLHLLASAPGPLRHRARVHLHVGTAETMATVLLLDRDELAPGDRAPAQLLVKSAVAVTWSQPLVIRSESPVVTIGGGHVLDPHASKLPRRDAQSLARLAALSADDPIERASAALFFSGLRGWDAETLPRTAGVDDTAAARRALAARGDLVEVALSPTRVLRLHRAALVALGERVEQTLEKLHQQLPLAMWIDRPRLASRFPRVEGAVLDTALAELARRQRVRLDARGVALSGHGPQLSDKKRQLLEQLIETYRQAGYQPPTAKEVQQAATHNQAAVPELLALAAAAGDLVKIDADYYLHAEAERQMRAEIASRLGQCEGLTLSEIRELLGTTRKYAVPFCEYLDRTGFTQRRGDLRVLKQ